MKSPSGEVDGVVPSSPCVDRAPEDLPWNEYLRGPLSEELGTGSFRPSTGEPVTGILAVLSFCRGWCPVNCLWRWC